MSIKGGRGVVRRLMEKSILNFHFDYLRPSLSCKAVLDTLSIIIMRIIYARVIRNIQLLHLSEGKGKLEREFFRVNYLVHEGRTSIMAQKIKKLSETPATFPMAAKLCMNDRLRTEKIPKNELNQLPHRNNDGEIGPKRDFFINF